MVTNPYPALPPLNTQMLAASNNLVYSHSIPVDTIEPGKPGDILYVNSKGETVWGDPLAVQEERYINDPFLKDSYEKYRAAKAELEMRIKLQKDAEDNGKQL